ncbi:uncharacterized protein LOC141910897 [Tubulanus polymorphus]|uniref:uncharacterized protein LOC141910897 n=1 Tax=Tubulanus polymorphus TaxID=672921 RepID=UPI003DA2CE2A
MGNEKETEMFLENLDEFINDENKVVTYKWLCRTLKVHVNHAKRMLAKFVEETKKKENAPALHITYLISGTKTHDAKTVEEVRLVCGEELHSVQSQFDSIISSQIYSVQRSKLKDGNALFIVNYESFKENMFDTQRFSAIKNAAAVRKSNEQISHLEQTAVQDIAAKREKAQAERIKNAPKPKGIAGMFAKAATTAQQKKQTEQQEKASEQTVKKKEEKKGMMAFTVKPTSGAGQRGAGQRGAEQQREKENEKNLPNDKKKSDNEKPVEKKNKGKSKKSVRRGSDHEESTQSKKRRRVKTVIESSSSSEDDGIDIDDDSPVPSPAAAEPRVTTPPPPVAAEPEPPRVERVTVTTADGKVKRRKRVRKMVPETFLDDDGFMVTKNKYVFESCTDDSDLEDAKKPAKSNPAHTAKAKIDAKVKAGAGKKKTSPSDKMTSSNKQTSLMNFFQKK